MLSWSWPALSSTKKEVKEFVVPVPITWSFAEGLAVPIPMLPPSIIVNRVSEPKLVFWAILNLSPSELSIPVTHLELEPSLK